MGLSLTLPRENFASPGKAALQKIFDQIAGHYDGINSVLSFRFDESWRRRAVRQTLTGDEQTLLDLGVGTGKFLSRFLRAKRWHLAAGIDFSSEMLERAEERLPADCRLVQGDIHDLPFEDETFDLVVSSFTLRSVKDRDRFFREVRRVLRPRGKTAFLCLTRPTSWLGRMIYAPYLKFYLPLMGGLLSAHQGAYQFLSQSIQAFPAPAEIAGRLECLGFQGIRIEPFTFGIATLILAHK